MVLRTFFALDNDNLVVTSSSNGGLVGNGVINESDTPDGTIFTYNSGGGTSITIDDTDTFSDNIPADNNLFFNDDDPGSHIIVDGGGIVADGNTAEAESIIRLRALDGAGNPTGPEIQITVFSQNDVTSNVWGFGTDTPLVDGVSYIKVGGDVTGTTRYTDFITCFEASTQITLQDGTKQAKDIVVGDMVWTRGDGYQPVLWVGQSKVMAQGPFAPVVFAPGALGNTDALIVSPEHRILIDDAQAELLFGTREVLVAAKHLCGLPGVSQQAGGDVHYVHFMFDRHQIVNANGVTCESFYLSDHSVSGVDAAQRKELLALFPSLEQGIAAFGDGAATILKGFEASVLCDQMTAGRIAKQISSQV